MSWDSICIGDCVEKIASWNPSRSVGDAPFLYIDLSSVDKEKKEVDRSSISSLLPSEAPSRARQLVKSGDVLVATVRPNLNGVALVPEEYEGAIASTGYCVLRPDHHLLDGKYLYYWVQTGAFVTDLMEKATGANYPAVSDKVIKESKIPLPPLEEQKRIATILDKADAIRRKRQQAIQLADELLRAVFLDMFGDPVTNPKGWEIEKIDNLCEVQGGLQVSKKRSELSISSPYLRVANVLRNSLNLDEIKEINLTQAEYDRVRLKRDDVLIVEGHGNPNEIGRSALWTGEIDGMVHQNHLIRVRVKSKEICPRFVNDYINSPGGRVQMMKASNTTSGLNTISTGIVKSTEIIVPPICLQDKYMSVVSKFGDFLVKNRMYENGIDLSFFSLRKKAFQGNL